MPKICIIIPVYKAEKYIHRCVDSILNQTFQDFELILVDDGSPDNCGAICDDYATKDSRVRVFHQENGGASAARNRGLNEAKGDYVVFCDSDDLVSPLWLEHLVSAAAADTMPVCSFCHDMVQLGEQKKLAVTAGVVLPRSEYYSFGCCGVGGYMCNSLYCNRVIQQHNLRLREQKEQGDYNEDLLFNLQYIRYVEKITYVGYADYLYDLREDSLSRGNRKYYFDKYAEKYRLWRTFLEENSQENRMPQLAATYLYHFLTALNWETYEGFRRIVHSEAVQHCVANVRDCAESPRIIKLIKEKKTWLLWIQYILHQLKGRLK